jgi:hypothetical protein
MYFCLRDLPLAEKQIFLKLKMSAEEKFFSIAFEIISGRKTNPAPPLNGLSSTELADSSL